MSFTQKSHIRFIVAVAAGKGGVGKSSASVHMASALKSMGYSVGVLDADIYGPSLGKMLAVDVPYRLDGEYLVPAICQGIPTMTLSYLRPEASIVRAPIANGIIAQFAQNILWGDLDYLIVDFPPGTGDIQLTLMQTLSFTGAVLVTTPQEVAVLDVQKAVQMFFQMGVPVAGVIENMAYFIDRTGEKQMPFGQGGAGKLSERYGFPILGEVPLDSLLSLCADRGETVIDIYPESLPARSYLAIVRKMHEMLCMWDESGGLREFSLEWEQ